MKSVNFKRAGADIRVAEESKSIKRKRHWDRIIYFIVFFALLFGIAYYAFTRLFYVRASSQVLYENVELRLLDDCRIMEYFTYEDDTVRFGDTLFRYMEDQDGNQQGNGSISFLNSDSGTFSLDLYQAANNLPLGDVVQSISLFDNRAFIAVNNSQKMEVVSLQNFKRLATINGLSSPRYFVGNGNKGYISDWISNKVYVLNLNS